MLTATQLFGRIYNPEGEEKCFYCGGKCGIDYNVKEHVKKTFTNRDIIRKPHSQYICAGCLETLNEKATINVNGEIREKQRTRAYSWIVNREEKIAYTKKHIQDIKEKIVKPIEPPFVIVIAKSGQKQLLFRSEIGWDKHKFPVMLEEEIIYVRPELLRKKIETASKIIAAIGKPAMKEFKINHGVIYYKYYGNLELFNKWKKEKEKPINRLAVYLSKNKKECANEYPKIGC